MKLGSIAVGFAFLALVVLPAVASDRPSYARDDTWSSIPPDTLEKSIELLGRDMVVDPASIQLRLLAPMKDGDRGMCGEVNVKDSFGGYVGFRPFVASLDSGSARILPAERVTPEGVKGIRMQMLQLCPQWSAYANREALIESAIVNDPDIQTDSSMLVTNFCNFTSDSIDAYNRCAQEQSKAERRTFALRDDTDHHDAAEALYADCYDVTPGMFKSPVAIYECMIAPGSPFEFKAP